MASFIYFYSKFTEEFLLLTAAGIFALLAVYCYTWVVKKRRLGAARDLVPAGMVKVYLNQLIGEAQFVRTQLFGLTGGGSPNPDALQGFLRGGASSPSHSSTSPINHSADGGEIPADLLERMKALESQLTEKEGIVVNVNIEKTKLLEEIENLKQNAKSGASAASGNNSDLIQKIRALEERLEEYALFEDDLANLKRLQQENIQLRKQLEQSGKAIAPAPEPLVPEVPPQVATSPNVPAPPAANSILDPSAIDALLNGAPATPPTAQTKPQAAPVAAAPSDEFEKLVDSVEESITAESPKDPSPGLEAAAPAPSSSIADKTDEELLKEFENLLNS